MYYKCKDINNMKKNIFYCFFFVSCATEGFYIKNSYDIILYKQISTQELAHSSKTMPVNNYLIIDLRAQSLYQKEHINNAISLPYNNIKSIVNISNIYHSQIIFYDTKNIYDFTIINIMKKLNITNFNFLQDGFSKWTNENRPTSSSTNNYI